MNRKLIATAGAVIIAVVGVAAPAVADDRPTFIPGQTLSPEAEAAIADKDKPAKLTPEEQADLTSKRLDNANKGVDTANKIVDTLGKLGGLFGFKPAAED